MDLVNLSGQGERFAGVGEERTSLDPRVGEKPPLAPGWARELPLASRWRRETPLATGLRKNLPLAPGLGREPPLAPGLGRNLSWPQGGPSGAALGRGRGSEGWSEDAQERQGFSCWGYQMYFMCDSRAI